SIYQLVQEPFGLSLISFVLILGIWLITFLFFVPLHQKIDKGFTQQKDLKRLVSLSWYRTLPWTLVLFLNLVNYLN
ncbi:MAG: hypothetical protein R3356_02260, partial [Eudoraea sp.]|nr:hypothetical protein [Eudoraea sp.]